MLGAPVEAENAATVIDQGRVAHDAHLPRPQSLNAWWTAPTPTTRRTEDLARMA